MTLLIQPELWRRLPGLRLVVAVAEGIDNHTQRPELETALAAAEDGLRAGWCYENPQSHPHVAAWRAASKALGISAQKHPSSIEALVRRSLGGGLPRINPLVDFYNHVSLRFVVPAGGWDLDDLGGHVHLGFTAGGEPFRALGSDETTAVEAGEVAYTDGQEVITRQFVWRQSESGKVTPATCRVFLVSEILAELGSGVAAEVEVALAGGLRQCFGVEVLSGVIEEGFTSWP